MATKQIILETRDVKVLVELLFRGLAYTDYDYLCRDGGKMHSLLDKVIGQLHEQNGHYLGNGEISFRK